MINFICIATQLGPHPNTLSYLPFNLHTALPISLDVLRKNKFELKAERMVELRAYIEKRVEFGKPSKFHVGGARMEIECKYGTARIDTAGFLEIKSGGGRICKSDLEWMDRFMEKYGKAVGTQKRN